MYYRFLVEDTELLDSGYKISETGSRFSLTVFVSSGEQDRFMSSRTVTCLLPFFRLLLLKSLTSAPIAFP